MHDIGQLGYSMLRAGGKMPTVRGGYSFQTQGSSEKPSSELDECLPCLRVNGIKTKEKNESNRA